MLKTLIRFDIEDALTRLSEKLQPHLRTLGIACVINLLIFGQRLFGGGLAADDISRFYFSGGEQASWLGRWLGGLLSQHVFSGPLHILPYFNGLISIFSITLAGYLTAYHLSVTKRVPAIIITLLCSATPFMVHNVYFNTNTTVFIGTALGIGGLCLGYRKEWGLKILGVLFLMLSIGIYQTIIQVSCVIILFRTILNLGDSKDAKSDFRFLLGGVYMAGYLLVAFLLSNVANSIVTSASDMAPTGRYAESLEVVTLLTYVDRIIGCYTIHTQLNFFSGPYSMGVKLFALFGFGCLALFLNLHLPKNFLSLRAAFFVGFVGSLPIIINLPQLLGLNVPTRAHFTIGWMMASFFMLSYVYRTWTKNIGLLLGTYLLLFGTLYINVFFYAATRQTDMDIMRANQIVSAIRMHPDYPGEEEPIKFKVLGVDYRTVIGWEFHRQSAFATFWSNTRIFDSFTDLNYVSLTEEEVADVKAKLIESERTILAYPDPSSFVFLDDVVVVFIDPEALYNDETE